MKLFLIPILIALSATSLIAQKKMEYKGFPSLVWPKLYNIDYVTGKDSKGEFRKPIFTEAVRKLEGKEIVLPGFLTPFDQGMSSRHFILSSLPLNACFFCGVGGPETVIEVNCEEEAKYTEKPVEVSGILRLNASDPDKMIYILEKARFLGEIDF